MTTYTGGHARTEGRQCARCRRTEAACARSYPCCSDCRHWPGWTADGEPPQTSTPLGGRPVEVVDEVTAKRREMWRRQRRQRQAS